MKAVIYARSATKVKAQSGRSIKVQVDSARQYARAHRFEIVETFTDAGFSGAKLDRPALTKLRNLIARDSIDTVIVRDLSRLTRSARDHSVLQRELAKRGTQIRSVADENHQRT